jgi:geranylgeranyl diphosphate synthase type II
MWHALGPGGKRLRPLLALASARACGGSEEKALPGALAVELIHSYSLVHDDLPALDNDPVRRGRPSCHMAHGEAMAILAGDALQSLAFEILSEGRAASPGPTLRAVGLLARAIGPLGMAGGQAMDLELEGGDPALSLRRLMAAKKTAELIAASIAIGAALSGAAPGDLETLRGAGLLAGEAFQIQDDILNVTGDPKVTGKAVGTDSARRKASVVGKLGSGRARRRAGALIAKAQGMLGGFRSDMLSSLFALMIHRDS